MSEKEEDYLKAIYRIVKNRGFARSVEIAEILDVKPASVTDMLKKLQAKSFIIYEKYRGILLTGKGREIAEKLFERETLIEEFFQIFGVEPKNANTIANKVEHYIDDESFERIKKFVTFIRSFKTSPRWIEHFNEFIKTGKLPECERIKDEERKEH
ncbi:MAG: transcriptional regulator MntR [Thermoplasmata archaeon]|nr:transcriptional regulator MntR [Thermoplasmata archaeon]